MTIFTKNLVDKLYEAKGGKITKKEAEQRIDDVLDLIKAELVGGNDVKIANFFNFFVRERKAKGAKNPQTGEDMVIPATKTVVAKMTKPLKEAIQGKRELA